MAIQIFILTQLMEEDTYPYKLKKQLADLQPLEKINGLTESKLYYHFESLVKQGLIEAKEIIKEEHRPDKQVFGITEKGREILPIKIYKLFESAEDIGDMVIGLANMKYVERGKVIVLLEKKIDKINKSREQLCQIDASHLIGPEHKVFAEFVDDYAHYKITSNLSFLERLIKHIEKEEI